MKPVLIDYIFLSLFFIIQIFIIFLKRFSIWKGVCGGNGVPQPNEVIKISAFLTINFEWAQVMFLHYPSDIETLISAATIIGITSFPNLKNIKNVNKKQEDKST
jgi:hypothetical protein